LESRKIVGKKHGSETLKRDHCNYGNQKRGEDQKEVRARGINWWDSFTNKGRVQLRRGEGKGKRGGGDEGKLDLRDTIVRSGKKTYVDKLATGKRAAKEGKGMDFARLGGGLT